LSQRIALPGGRQASYEVVGSGRPTLMFPGGPGFSGSYMRPDADLLADELCVYLIDPHGSGDSTAPATQDGYSPGGHAFFYEEVRQALGLDRVIVLGHSFGATTSLAYAATYPEAVSACVAVAPFGVGTAADLAAGGGAAAEMEAAVRRHEGAEWYPAARAAFDGFAEAVLASTDPAQVEALMSTLLSIYTAHPERESVRAGLELARSNLKVNLEAMKAWEGGLYQQIDLRPLLARVGCPTLVVAGELDFICGPAQARPIHSAIPHSQLELIPDCGHFLSLEAPGAYRRAVLDFLSRNRL